MWHLPVLLVSGVVAVIGDTAAGAGSAAAAGGAAAAARPKDGTNSVAFTFRADNLELTSSILVRITFPYSRRTKGEREKKRNENKKREREKNSSGHVSLFLSFRNVSFFFLVPPRENVGFEKLFGRDWPPGCRCRWTREARHLVGRQWTAARSATSSWS